MKSSASISTNIFDELIVTVERIGVEKTIKTLQEARSNILILSDVNVENIINAVIELTGVQKERILHGTDRSDERKIALALVVYHVKNKLGISYKEMMKIFDKDKAALCRYYTIIDKLPKVPKTDFDKKITAYNKKLSQLLTKD